MLLSRRARARALHTPPVQRRRREIAPIENPAKRAVTFSRERQGLFEMVSDLCGLTGARAAVVVLSSTDKLYFFGGSSVEEMEEIIFDRVRCNGEEGLDWDKKQHRRREIAKVADQVQRRNCFLDGLPTLIKMASELCTLTDARAAVVVFSDTGFLYHFGNSSFENIISDWVNKQRESCKTEEAVHPLNLKYKAVPDYVRDKLKGISGSGNSGVGVDCDSLTSPSALDKNFDWDRMGRLRDEFFPSSESSGVKSTPMCFDHEDCGIDPDLPKDGNSSLILPKDSAEGYGNTEDEIFAGLEDITPL